MIAPQWESVVRINFRRGTQSKLPTASGAERNWLILRSGHGLLSLGWLWQRVHHRFMVA
jgi:hypothetical protein